MYTVDPILRIPRLAMETGYDLAGFAPLQISQEDRENLRRFTMEGLRGEMEWFGRYEEIRENPSRIMEGAKSALVLLTAYRDPLYESVLGQLTARVARYAVGRDYHRLLRKKGAALLAKIQAEFPSLALQGRITVDSAPVPEKILARMAGLGWQGKNTNLIHPKLGSYFLISVLFLNLELPSATERGDGDGVSEYGSGEREGDGETAHGPASSSESRDRCGSCRQCLDACPTGALSEYRIDPLRCLSYQTIENRNEIPAEIQGRLSGWLFGCDICQEVCPYNRRPSLEREPSLSSTSSERSGKTDPASLPREKELFARGELLEYIVKPYELNQEEWDRLSTGTPLRRVALEKWNRTLRTILFSSKEGRNRT